MKKYLLSLFTALVLSVGFVSAGTPNNTALAPKITQAESVSKVAAKQDIIIIIIDNGDGTIDIIIIY
ncbi:hypothetical protein ACSBL2_16280 [Pedobacter sp. AW31-3R]|uniref:hypothetical protein n=1 Tax=Pedobacter sp. AW31-3R TaxID=3445781 RepID=UPI003FA03069